MSLLSFEPFFRDDIYACIYHFRIRLPKTYCISASYADLSPSKNFFSRHLSPDKTRKSHLDFPVDRYKGGAVSYVHLAPGISPDVVLVEHAEKVDVCDDMVSNEYNRFKETKCLKISFKDYCKYKILTN